MGASFNVIYSYISESNHFNCVIKKDEVKNIKSQDYVKFLKKDIIEKNIYSSW